LFDLQEQNRAAQDVLRRLQVRASIDGVVVNLQIHTTGGVIQPGATLMGIVPSKDRKIIEARVDPVDIDVVRVGLEARVRLTALPQRHLVPLKGRVVSVSADRFVDEKTGQPYFRVRIILTESPKVNGKEIELRPGMQAEVMIVTGSRTLLEYITQPLLDSFNRAFREG